MMNAVNGSRNRGNGRKVSNGWNSFEIPLDSIVGHASRIRERVMDTGSLDTEKPVLQNRGAAFQLWI